MEETPRFTRHRIHTGGPIERTLLVAGDITGNGQSDLIVGGRTAEMGLHFYTRDSGGVWTEHRVSNDFPRMEAGGALYDIDGDGRLEFIAGSDHGDDKLYWFDPGDDPTQPWTMHTIAAMPEKKSHDQIVVDLNDGNGPTLFAWNQGGNALLAFAVPSDPTVSPWPGMKVVTTTPAHEEGFAVADVDGDGRDELVAGLAWIKPDGNGEYHVHRFAEDFYSSRHAVGDFDGDGKLEIVISEGDASYMRPGHDFGRLAMLKAGDDPTRLWHVEILRDDLEDPHSLIAADFDGDGRMDFYVAELGHPRGLHKHPPRHIVYFNRADGLQPVVIDQGVGTHEAKLVSIDGRPAIAGKPYRGGDDPPRTTDDDSIHLWTIAG